MQLIPRESSGEENHVLALFSRSALRCLLRPSDCAAGGQAGSHWPGTRLEPAVYGEALQERDSVGVIQTYSFLFVHKCRSRGI